MDELLPFASINSRSIPRPFFIYRRASSRGRVTIALRRERGYDLFSANALFPVMLETYLAFNWIFVAPQTAGEKEFRYLPWKLDGLFEKRKFEHSAGETGGSGHSSVVIT